MKKIVTFGELMLRLMPDGYHRFVQVNHFGAEFGGAEANVAVSLSNFGMSSVYVSALPQNEVGQAALNSIRRYGVNTDYVVRSGKRLGIYYLEKGASQRGSLCIYDRAGSAFAESKSTDYNWKEIFKGATHFHITGVTPALGKNIAAITLEACKMAKSLGLTVSFDLNYRSKLWTAQAAKKVFTQMASYTDICIANEEDAETVFGIKTKKTNVDNGIIDKAAYEQTAKTLSEKFGFKKVAITLRQSISANDNNWSALLYADGKCFFSKEYAIHIVERVGGGDAFAAGLIYAFQNGKGNQEAVEFASAASCLKHTIEGDFNTVTVSEVERLANGSGTGRVQR